MAELRTARLRLRQREFEDLDDPADDFDHPRLEPGLLHRHMLYRLRRPA